MKKIFLVALALLQFLVINSQNLSLQKSNPISNPFPSPKFGTSVDFLPVSPQTGSIGIFGQIPVGNFTGTASILVPLYEAKYKEISVPISIDYHASGIKPDIFPGPVGLGWALRVGGIITRTIKGAPDYGRFPPEDNISIVKDDPRGEANWSSNETLEEYIMGNGVLYDGPTDPDEYYFDINGHTGFFYLNHSDTFRIQSTQGGTFLITIDKGLLTGKFKGLNNDLSSGKYKDIELDVIRGFTMIDDKGIKYKFGGSFESIEFSRPAFSNWEEESPGGSYIDSYYQAMSWHLISIESPNGYSVDFNYEQESYITKTRYSNQCLFERKTSGGNYEFTQTPSANIGDGEKSILIHACALKEIVLPIGKISFINSIAKDQLGYPNLFPDDDTDYQRKNSFCYKLENGGNNYLKFYYQDMIDSEPTNIYPHKVDTIKIYNNQETPDCLMKEIEFVYSKDTEARMKLLKLKIKGKSKSAIDQEYKFEYNEMDLPSYLSGATDYYGFYNKKFIYSDFSTSRSIVSYIMDDTSYFDKKMAPDSAFAQAEILKKIIYPTSGYTTFQYEPHEYGGENSIWPFEVKNTTNIQTGGVRIKSIKNYSEENTLLSEKKYHYVKNFLNGGTKSSGILAYKPQYVEKYENINLIYEYNNTVTNDTITQKYPLRYFIWFSTNPIYPMSSFRGNHVTYSEVTVEEPDNGFKVYKYKNFDNGYADKFPVNYVSNKVLDVDNNLIHFYDKHEGLSLQLERGQILAEEVYDKSKNIQKKVNYKYNEDPDRFSENVRYIRRLQNSVNYANQTRSSTMVAGLHYTYFPFLKEKITTDYMNSTISQKEEFTYNQYRLPKTVSFKDEQNRNRITRTSYPFDAIQSDQLYQKMVNKHMLNFPIEQSSYIDNILMSKISYLYMDNLAFDNSNLILPYKQFKQYGSNSPFGEIEYSKYDITGNPICIKNLKSEDETIILWSYKGMYPVVKIEGLSYNEVLSLLGESFIKDLSYQDKPDLTRISLMFMANEKARLTTYTYEPHIGITSITNPSGITTYYTYDESNRLKETYTYEYGKKRILSLNFYNYSSSY